MILFESQHIIILIPFSSMVLMTSYSILARILYLLTKSCWYYNHLHKASGAKMQVGICNFSRIIYAPSYSTGALNEDYLFSCWSNLSSWKKTGTYQGIPSIPWIPCIFCVQRKLLNVAEVRLMPLYFLLR
jgi:hypothetical protein